jgi:hypothetical protein
VARSGAAALGDVEIPEHPELVQFRRAELRPATEELRDAILTRTIETLRGATQQQDRLPEASRSWLALSVLGAPGRPGAPLVPWQK